MELDCIEGWVHVTALGSITLEDRRVIILDGICNSCDLCGITACRFYDDSPEATRRFLHAQARQHTLEGLLERMQRH